MEKENIRAMQSIWDPRLQMNSDLRGSGRSEHTCMYMYMIHKNTKVSKDVVVGDKQKNYMYMLT